jgi:hypothetical protein
MKLQTAKCTTCGASLKLEVDKAISECAYCKSQIIVSNALDFNKVEVDKSKDIIKYRDNLKKYVRNNSIEEILRVSNQILDILPKDFLASYFAAYAHQVKGEPNYIYEFYSNILEHTPNELEEVVEHINKRSDLRDEDRIIKFLSNSKFYAIDDYKINLKIRIEQEDNYADIERDIFICCSSKNEDVVKELVNKLENDGHSCWIYYRNIREDSKSYLENIEKAVKKSNIFLLVSSSQAIVSKDVNYEISLARNFGKPRLEFKIDTSERNTNIKDFYKGIKWIDGSKSFDDGIDKLLIRILELKNQLKQSVIQEFNEVKSKSIIDSEFLPDKIEALIDKKISVSKKIKSNDEYLELGKKYLIGDTVVKDLKLAYDNIRVAAENGHQSAQLELSLLYLNNRNFKFIQTASNEDVNKEIFKWAKLSIVNGNLNSVALLGYLYYMGIGTEKNWNIAKEFLEQTITLNNENKINILKSDLIFAIFILGQIAFNGEGFLKNYDVAFNYYSANENENHAESLNMIGVCYEKGLGTTKDEEKAYQYFLKASKLGHLGAAAKIQIINASKNINKFLNYFIK